MLIVQMVLRRKQVDEEGRRRGLERKHASTLSMHVPTYEFSPSHPIEKAHHSLKAPFSASERGPL